MTRRATSHRCVCQEYTVETVKLQGVRVGSADPLATTGTAIHHGIPLTTQLLWAAPLFATASVPVKDPG